MERCENDVCGLDKYKQVVQLHDKDENSKEYPIFPVTYTHAVYDGKTGANLESMLAQFNNVFLQYQGTAKDTRLLLPKEMRRKGVQITYRNMDDEVVTEKCVNDSQSDNDHWGLDANWMRIDELSLQGDISVSKSGTWIINGADTGVKALGPKGDNGLTPWMKTIDNKLYYSYDNQTWELASDYIAAWFRFTGTSGSSQAGNIGKIQISRDEGKTWADLSGTFTNNLHIKGYVATTSDLPSSAVQGDIYGVGPTYAESDTEHTNPIYRLFVKNENVWVDNGQFTSIAAGVVQEFGDSETEVMSQKAITDNIASMLIAFVGFGTSTTTAGVTKKGDVYYNVETKLLKRCVYYNSEYPNESTYAIVPYIKGALYTYNQQIYMFDGNNMVILNENWISLLISLGFKNRNINIQLLNGYISTEGGVFQSDIAVYSKPILLKKDEYIIVGTITTNAAVISITDIDGNSYFPVKLEDKDELQYQYYAYKALEDTYVCICGRSERFHYWIFSSPITKSETVIPIYNKSLFNKGYYNLSGETPILENSTNTLYFSCPVHEGDIIIYDGGKFGDNSRSYAITDNNNEIIEVADPVASIESVPNPYIIIVPKNGTKAYFNLHAIETVHSKGRIYYSGKKVDTISKWLNKTFDELATIEDLVAGYYPMADENIGELTSSTATKCWKTSVTEGQSFFLFGKAYGQNSRTYAITDSNGVILQVADALTEIDQLPTLITIPKNGVTLYINNSIYSTSDYSKEQNNFAILSGFLPYLFNSLTNNENKSNTLSLLSRQINCDWNNSVTNNYSLCWIKSILSENKLPFNVGFYFSEYPAKNGKLYYSNSLLGEVKEIADFSKVNTGFDTETFIESRVVAVSPKHNTIINSVFDRYPGFGLRILEDGVFGEINMEEPMQAWLYNTGIEFVYNENGKEYCLYGEYSHARKSTRRIFKAEYPYINPNNWKVVFEMPSAEGVEDGILHIHNIQKDPFSNYIYCICGDSAAESRWFYSSDLGETWNLLVKDKPAGYLRAINFIFLENDIYWASDDISHYLLHAKRNSNGLIDVSTIEVLKNLPSMQATNSLAYIQSLNCLFFYDRVYEDSTRKNKLKEYIYDIAKDKIIILREFEKVDDTAYGSWGNRGKCYNHFPNSSEPHLAMGIVDEYAPCIFKLIGNDKKTYGSILYKLE